MKKIILFALGMLFLVSTVSAFGEGDNLTAQQFNSINFDTVNLQCQYNGFDIKPLPKVVVFKFSCLSARPVEDYFTIIRKPLPQMITFKDIFSCLAAYTPLQCQNGIREVLLERFQKSKLGLREELKTMQSNVNWEQGDITFDDGDLNG